ncbi:Wall-associated receptor kinase-like 10, partial [Mucuna pruriens]
MLLKFVYIIILVTWRTYPLTCAQYQNQTIAQPFCNSTCGNVPIPYPFGMGDPKCYASEWFEIECNSTSEGEKPYLKSNNIGLEVISIYLSGYVLIKNPIYHGTGKETGIELGGPFVYSQYYNSFVAVGCQSAAVLRSNKTTIGCMSMCYEDRKSGSKLNNIDVASCRGTYCYEASLPPYLSEYTISCGGYISVSNSVTEASGCRYALIIGNNNKFPYRVLTIGDLKNLYDIPAVLEWEITNSTLKVTAITLMLHLHNSQVGDVPASFPLREIPTFREVVKCSYIHLCVNLTLTTISKCIGVSSRLGTIILLLGKKIEKKRKEKFFQQNGGLLLEQRLSSGKVNVDKIKLLSLKDLEKATDHFNINSILGKGGQGTVYKGMLVDGKIVAVKKFKVKGNVEEFINEFIILSQINHRNVVKLLGCCLESEVPLLVYEFIPNGTLFEYIHGQNDDLPMTWDVRLRIATEVARALFYLHSAASQPIYHRDIKSTNILLDENYKAKVADFGASRMVSIEDTHLTTVVQGTFGYLDPEYFHTSRLTEKSDVYSFGVVLVELLTGKKPISSVKHQELRSLASYFVLCVEENRLFDIIDERIMREGEKENIIVVANLARRCLELTGRKRPTMEEVTSELESIRKLENKSNAQEHHEELEIDGIEDFQFWAVYSTTSNTGQTSDSKASILEIMPILSTN